MCLESFQILLMITIQLDLEIHQMDIVGVYLNEKLIEEIYMKQIPGYKDGSNNVLQLRKTLYGLKQAGQVWNQWLHKALTELNYTHLYTDTCIYVCCQNRKLAIIAFHLNNSTIFAGANHMDMVKSKLKSKFNTHDLRELNHFVGIKITCDWVNHITLSPFFRDNIFAKFWNKLVCWTPIQFQYCICGQLPCAIQFILQTRWQSWCYCINMQSAIPWMGQTHQYPSAFSARTYLNMAISRFNISVQKIILLIFLQSLSQKLYSRNLLPT